MYPNQHFDKPGKSPFMDMELVPKYAGEAGDAAGVRIDPALVQSLGLRTAEAHRGTLGSGLTVTGPIGYNQRDIAIVQPRASGFVQRTHNSAPDAVIGARAPLVALLLPDWGGDEEDNIDVSRPGDPELARPATRRPSFPGKPPRTLQAVER